MFLVFHNIAPLQLFDVTMAQSCQGRKQGCSFEDFAIAWCGCQLVEFFQCQVLALAFLVVYVLNFGCKVNGQVAINEGLVETCLEYREIGGCGIG